MIQFPNTWYTVLLAYQFVDYHMTVVFGVLTPENYDLTMKVCNRLFSTMPKEIEVKFIDKTFESPYNEKKGKIAQEVEILTPTFSKFIPFIERFNRANFRPHISVPKGDKHDGPLLMKITLKMGTMHKSRFLGFPQYKYNYIFDKNPLEGTSSSK